MTFWFDKPSLGTPGEKTAGRGTSPSRAHVRASAPGRRCQLESGTLRSSKRACIMLSGSERDKGIMGAERPTSAIGKAFAIIEHLVSADEPPQLADLSEALGMPKPSVHRMLLQLEETGIVTRDIQGKAYYAGARLTRLSVSAMGQLMRRDNIRDVMHRLVSRLGETCNLGVLDGDRVLYLERVKCEALIDLDRVEILTPNTLSGDALRARLELIRTTGLSVNREEYMLGLDGVSVPVHDPS